MDKGGEASFHVPQAGLHSRFARHSAKRLLDAVVRISVVEVDSRGCSLLFIENFSHFRTSTSGVNGFWRTAVPALGGPDG